MRDITDAEFDDVVVKTTNIVVVDFWAPWCAPCRAIAPQLKELAEKYPAVIFVKVNVDESPVTVEKYGIRSIPAFQIWTTLPGEERAPLTVVGAKGMAYLADFLEE